LRQHPLQLKGIPTLVRWQDNAPTARLGPEIEAASTQEEADSLIKEFLEKDRRQAGNGLRDDNSVDVQKLMQQLDEASVGNGAVAH
jgi:hypothetical protein